jgi:ribonuclease Z
MSISLTALGCHSATPRENAHPTAQILQIKNHTILIDCGEGTQIQLRKHKIRFSKINHIFISHLHGDHFFGLIGLISTFSLLNRKKPLNIYAPKGLQEVIELQMKVSESQIGFPLIFHILKSKKSQLIFEDKSILVSTIPLKHRIYANGFLFKQKIDLRKLNINEVTKYSEIEICDYHNLKKGKDLICKDGTIIKNENLTIAPAKTRSYAYCSDTSYHPAIIQHIKEVDLLYHEATFLSDREELATITGHSTARQAALIAKGAKVKTLILGHFSSRYKDYSAFKKEAQHEFTNTLLCEEGKEIEIKSIEK